MKKVPLRALVGELKYCLFISVRGPYRHRP